MDKKTITVFCIFTLLLIIGSVSALQLEIVDKSYLGQNEFTVTNQDGIQVANFTGDHTMILPQGKSYFIDYKPVGIFDFGENLPADPFFLKTTTAFFQRDKMLAGLIALFGLLVLLLTVRLR